MYCYCVYLCQWSHLNSIMTLYKSREYKILHFFCLSSTHIPFLGNTTLMFYLKNQPPSFTSLSVGAPFLLLPSLHQGKEGRTSTRPLRLFLGICILSKKSKGWNLIRGLLFWLRCPNKAPKVLFSRTLECHGFMLFWGSVHSFIWLFLISLQ